MPLRVVLPLAIFNLEYGLAVVPVLPIWGNGQGTPVGVGGAMGGILLGVGGIIAMCLLAVVAIWRPLKVVGIRLFRF